MSEHTPTPWRAEIGRSCANIYDANGCSFICVIGRDVGVPNGRPIMREKAERIVRCSNGHDELVKALREAESLLIMCYDSSEDNEANPIMQKIGEEIERAQAALAKAEANATLQDQSQTKGGNPS